MRAWGTIGLLAVMLAGCSGGEDFAVEVNKSPAQVLNTLGGLDFSMEKAAVSGLEVVTTRPNAEEIVYTMPATDVPGNVTGESVIRLKLEPLRGGAATKIHASVDVPPVPMLMGESGKVLSEQKVEKELRKVLGKLASGVELRSLLSSVAVASSTKLQSQINYQGMAGNAMPMELALNDGDYPGDGEADDWGATTTEGGNVPIEPGESDGSGNDGAASDWGSGTRD